MIVLSTSDMTTIYFANFGTESQCFRSVNSNGDWYIVGYEQVPELPAMLIRLRQTVTYEYTENLFERAGGGSTFSQCHVIKATSANLHLGCITTDWESSTQNALFLVISISKTPVGCF